MSHRGVVLTGRKASVPDAAAAGFFVVSAVDGSSLQTMAYLVDANHGVRQKPMATLDIARPLTEVLFDRAPAEVLGSADAIIAPALEVGAICLAAEMLGGARWCLETATEYALNRYQFGRPIGSFQAVKHACARVVIDVELAAAAVGAAVDSASENGSRDLASLAKCQASRAFRSAAWTAIHVLGGIGVTMEHDAHLYFRRAHASEMLMGDSRHHRARLTASMSAKRPPSSGHTLPRQSGRLDPRVSDVDPATADLEERARDWMTTNHHLWADFPEDDGTRSAESVQRARHLQKLLSEAGLASISWPVEYGGAGMDQQAEATFARIAAEYKLPLAPLRIATNMVAPAIFRYGTEEQRRRLLPPIVRGEALWCQLFSEPGAGSDLASLETRADLVGSDWIINGQKVWSSHAQHADLGLLLARSNRDVPKHAGITVLVLDMHQESVVVRPITLMSGDVHFNEVFITDAHVNDSDRIGPVDGGWAIARATLTNERTAIGTRVGPSKHGLRVSDLIELAEARGSLDDPLTRDRLVDVWIAEQCLSLFSKRLREMVDGPGSAGAIAKLASAELARTAATVGYEIAGQHAVAWDDATERDGRWAKALLAAPATSIGGGTDEMMLTAIGDRILGLPREPDPARSVPFKELRIGTVTSPGSL
jgi:alkylation response protein AidB-like acyl-CoA dehydrogenase